MKRIAHILLLLLGFSIAFSSCEKAPFITITSPTSFTFTDTGGSQTISFTCNRDWKASSSEPWLKISPSSGTVNEQEQRVTITCEANDTYDARNCSVTITIEGLTESIAITQDSNFGVIVNPTSITLSKEAQSFEIEVQSNIDYSVSVDKDCEEWLSQVGTKALSSSKYGFKVSVDETYDSRSGKIYILGKNNELLQTVEVFQSQVDAIVYTNIQTNGPGQLYSLLYEKYNGEKTDKEWGNENWDIKSLRLSGSIDARDFSTIKWNLNNIENIDLSGAKIESYSGVYGTNEGYYDGGVYSIYPENEIPIGAFFYWENNYIREFPEEYFDEGMPSLNSIILPDGITTIRRNAFARAYNLKEINIPEGVTRIETVAFRYCMSIEKLYLPSTLNYIGWLCFTEMTRLKEVHIAAKEKPYEDLTFEGREQTDTPQSFGNMLDASQIGGDVEKLYRGYIVTMEGYESYNPKTNATLYVPKGCKEEYSSWEIYFDNIVEEDD